MGPFPIVVVLTVLTVSGVDFKSLHPVFDGLFSARSVDHDLQGFSGRGPAQVGEDPNILFAEEESAGFSCMTFDCVLILHGSAGNTRPAAVGA